MPDRELERDLSELGSHIEYPPTPDLARAVRHRLDEEGAERPTGSRRFRSSLPSLRWAVAATAFLLIVAIPALSPAIRAAVTGLFDAGHTASGGQAASKDRDVPAAEKVAQDESAAESARPAGGEASMAPTSGGLRPSGERFGDRISLREAQVRVAGDKLLLLPDALGKPDEVYAGEPPNEEVLTLVYGAGSELPPLGDSGIGLILTELPGDVASAYFPEGELPETGLQRVQVGGKPGYWVPAGRDVPSPSGRTEERPHGSVLLWEQEGVALRLEANIPEQEAIRIAGSVR